MEGTSPMLPMSILANVKTYTAVAAKELMPKPDNVSGNRQCVYKKMITQQIIIVYQYHSDVL